MPTNEGEAEFNLFEDLKRAIRKSGVSVSKLSRMCDLNPAQIFRFLSGERGLNTTSIDKICRALRLRLTAEKPPKGDAPPAKPRRKERK
jgi:DNA-binding phage protein